MALNVALLILSRQSRFEVHFDVRFEIFNVEIISRMCSVGNQAIIMMYFNIIIYSLNGYCILCFINWFVLLLTGGNTIAYMPKTSSTGKPMPPPGFFAPPAKSQTKLADPKPAEQGVPPNVVISMYLISCNIVFTCECYVRMKRNLTCEHLQISLVH